MKLSLATRCYITMAVSLIIALVGTVLVAKAIETGAAGWAGTGLVVGLALIAVAVFVLLEASHLTVVAAATTLDESAAQAKALLDQAKQRVIIAAGEGHAEFWDRSEVSEALVGAVDRDVAVEVLIGSKATATAETLLNLVHSGRINLYEVPYTPSPHFIVADSRGFRIESPHAPGAASREGYAWQRGSMGASILEDHFAALRSGATQWGWK